MRLETLLCIFGYVQLNISTKSSAKTEKATKRGARREFADSLLSMLIVVVSYFDIALNFSSADAIMSNSFSVYLLISALLDFLARFFLKHTITAPADTPITNTPATTTTAMMMRSLLEEEELEPVEDPEVELTAAVPEEEAEDEDDIEDEVPEVTIAVVAARVVAHVLGPDSQTPAWHVSFAVQELPSEQEVPFTTLGKLLGQACSVTLQ